MRFRSSRVGAVDELRVIAPVGALAHWAGKGDFHEIGDKWAETLRMWGGLRPTDVVLDVGCGVGRMAVALAPFLAPSARYEGFDIDRKSIRWCKREIETRWPASHFQRVDIWNGYYNSKGRQTASQFTFPYPDGSFDFVIAISVLTHLLPDAAGRYLHEISRVLKPSGRCLVSYFVVNQTVRSAIDGGAATRFTFGHELAPGCFADSVDVPERSVAYEEALVRQLYEDAGLAVEEPVRYGSWSGTTWDVPPRHSQDVIVASRVSAP